MSMPYSISFRVGVSIPGPMSLPGRGWICAGLWECTEGWHVQAVGISGGGYVWDLGVTPTSDMGPARYTTQKVHPQVLTSSGGHQSGWYASYYNAFFLRELFLRQIFDLVIRSLCLNTRRSLI